MLFEQKLTGPIIPWPKKPADRIAPPTEPQIVQWLENYNCTCKVGFNCYEIINEKGDALEFPFGKEIGEWLVAIKQVAGV